LRRVASEVFVLAKVELELDTPRSSPLRFWVNLPPCRASPAARLSAATGLADSMIGGALGSWTWSRLSALDPINASVVFSKVSHLPLRVGSAYMRAFILSIQPAFNFNERTGWEFGGENLFLYLPGCHERGFV